ncbi:MAG: GGDEF domain-containing protein [Actinomycetes bacterium]
MGAKRAVADRTALMARAFSDLVAATTRKSVRDVAARAFSRMASTDAAALVFDDSGATVSVADGHKPPKDELLMLQALADVAAAMLAHLEQVDELEDRLERRAAELAAAQTRLVEQSLTDDLTGVYNRRGFNVLAEHQLTLVQRQGMDAVVAFVDVDDLKSINRNVGYRAGSRAIREVATVLRNNFRDTDVVARVGGDDFAVLLVNPQGRELQIMRRVDADLANRNVEDGRKYELSVSFGLADLWAADDLAGLMEAAEQDMRRSKRAKNEPL